MDPSLNAIDVILGYFPEFSMVSTWTQLHNGNCEVCDEETLSFLWENGPLA